MALSITSILGLAGADDPLTDELSTRSLAHARATGEALSAIDPAYIGVLSLMVIAGTRMAERVARGSSSCRRRWPCCRELREILAATDVSGALFRSNHASNYLPVGGSCPRTRPACSRLSTTC